MKAQELRIGNWVNYLSTDVEVGGEEIAAIARGVQVESIKLTEEWLEKFGFKEAREGGNRWYNGSKFNIITWSTGKVDFFIDEDELPCSLQYVHQLQNLYFALTGKEL